MLRRNIRKMRLCRKGRFQSSLAGNVQRMRKLNSTITPCAPHSMRSSGGWRQRFGCRAPHQVRST